MGVKGLVMVREETSSREERRAKAKGGKVKKSNQDAQQAYPRRQDEEILVRGGCGG